MIDRSVDWGTFLLVSFSLYVFDLAILIIINVDTVSILSYEYQYYFIKLLPQKCLHITNSRDKMDNKKAESLILNIDWNSLVIIYLITSRSR